jgi:hypothetical protein
MAAHEEVQERERERRWVTKIGLWIEGMGRGEEGGKEGRKEGFC